MAPGSALLGQPPANDDDYTIIQAVLVSIGLVGKLPPEKGLHFPGPPRPPPDQYHFETTAPKILVGAAIGSFLIITVTAARLVVRGRNAKLRYGWDDVFITIGAFTALTSPALSIATVVVGGLGKHMYDATYNEYYYFDRLKPGRFLGLYVPLAFVKISIVCFYMRLTSLSSRAWMIFHWVLLFLCSSLLITSVCLITFQCHNITAYWDPKRYATWDHPPECLPLYGIVKALNGWHILTDATLLISPIVMLWRVQMKFTKKLRVWSIGLVGCVNIVLSVYTYYKVNVWSISELTLGIITASLPILAVPASKFASLFSSKKSPSPSTSRAGRYFFDKMQRNVRRRNDDPIRLDDSLETFRSNELSRSSTRVGAEEERQNGSVSGVQGGGGVNSSGGGGEEGGAGREMRGGVTHRWTMEGYKKEKHEGDIQISIEGWDLERGRPAEMEPTASPAAKPGDVDRA
ncbi:MAG: hypothetical protein LQ351_003434 [Letrouitia transgressa]|nr:MAG: hypothetical protein LQ351_003434 [Letrouitia transgressa]